MHHDQAVQEDKASVGELFVVVPKMQSALSLIKPQSVQRVIDNNDKLLILTDTLMFCCTKIVEVCPSLDRKQPYDTGASDVATCQAKRATIEPKQEPSLVVCEAVLMPPEAGVSTVVRQVTTTKTAPPVVQPTGARYWGALRWKVGHALYYHKACQVLTNQLPSFRAEVQLQQTMSAAGVSLPMHGTAAVGHCKYGLYTSWLCCDGALLTQPWMRACLTSALQKHHTTSPHKEMPVGIICLSRPDVLLSNMSLAQAKWLAAHTNSVQGSVNDAFAVAAERGYVHLSADQPSSVALTVQHNGAHRAYLIDWSCCAERVRIRASNQSEVMAYLMGIPDGVVMSACQAFSWHHH